MNEENEGWGWSYVARPAWGTLNQSGEQVQPAEMQAQEAETRDGELVERVEAVAHRLDEVIRKYIRIFNAAAYEGVIDAHGGLLPVRRDYPALCYEEPVDESGQRCVEDCNDQAFSPVKGLLSTKRKMDSVGSRLAKGQWPDGDRPEAEERLREYRAQYEAYCDYLNDMLAALGRKSKRDELERLRGLSLDADIAEIKAQDAEEIEKLVKIDEKERGKQAMTRFWATVVAVVMIAATAANIALHPEQKMTCAVGWIISVLCVMAALGSRDKYGLTREEKREEIEREVAEGSHLKHYLGYRAAVHDEMCALGDETVELIERVYGR